MSNVNGRDSYHQLEDLLRYARHCVNNRAADISVH